MINEERLKLMTKTALLEKKSKKEFGIDKFYKRDYVSWHLILVWISVSIAYLAVIGGAALFLIEKYPEKLQNMNFGMAAFMLLMVYVIFVFLYIIIGMVVFSRRYEKAMGVVRSYAASLKQLDRMYEKDEEAAELDNTTSSLAKKKAKTSKSDRRRKGDKKA